MTESKHAPGSRRWLPWAALVAVLVVGGCTTGSASSSGASATPGNSGTTSGSSTVSACAVTPVANEVVPSG